MRHSKIVPALSFRQRSVILLAALMLISCVGLSTGPTPAEAQSRYCTWVKSMGWWPDSSAPCRKASLRFKRKVARTSWSPTGASCRFARGQKRWICQAGKNGAQNDPNDSSDVAHGWVRGRRAVVTRFS